MNSSSQDFSALQNASDEEIRDVLVDAHIPSLLLTLIHITGDAGILDGDIQPLMGPLDDTEDGLEEEERERARALAFDALVKFRDGGCKLPEQPATETLQRMMVFTNGQPIAAPYLPYLEEELAISDKDYRLVPLKGEIEDEKLANFHVVIVGAGMSGILAAIRLQEAGIPFTMVDKNEKPGGTWYENTYPGCRVDSPNHLYSYHFEHNNKWPGYFSTREILFEYFDRCIADYGLKKHMRLSTKVIGATYDERENTWRVEVEGPGGEKEMIAANSVITAVGQLNIPKIPDLPGVESFQGPYFHSGHWDHDVDLKGKRVAVIGTGASATQFVPEIADQIGSMVVFQRSPPWMLPTPNYHEAVSPKVAWMLENLPFYNKWYRFWLFKRDASDGAVPMLFADEGWNAGPDTVSAGNNELRQAMVDYISEQVKDAPDLAAHAIPDYPPGGKRPLRDNGLWFETLKRDNVQLVADPVSEITATGVRTERGQAFEADVIIYGTGFSASHFLWPMSFTGRAGVKLEDQWAKEGPRAYLGVTMPNFPNLFCLYGPNTNIVVGSSIVFYSECEMRYIMGCLKLLFKSDKAAIECKQSVHDEYNREVDERSLKTAWGAPNVRSWYKNEDGRVTQNWPGTHFEYWKRTLKPNPADFDLR
jgi:4-hydroxyacetophenone monooxygenase